MKYQIYADHNATTPLGHLALISMEQFFSCWGNPSSTHAVGRQANKLLQQARQKIADKLGVLADEIVFTSGGSEANASVIMGSYFSNENLRLLTSRVEHSSLRGPVEFLQGKKAQVQFIQLTETGELNFPHFERQLDDFRPDLVSLMAANNETGILFPIPEILDACRKRNILVHTDAVQAFGKVMPEFFNGADFISVSAHKVYGPKGIGALVVKRGRKLSPLMNGGTQEIKRRGGTQNLIGAGGFAGACDEMSDNHFSPVLRDRFEARILATLDGVSINGAKAPRVPNTSNIRFEGIPLEVLLSALDLDGICASAGSACSSGSITPSLVLIEMGLPAEAARECLRFSWGKSTTEADVDTVSDAVIHHVKRIRERRRG